MPTQRLWNEPIEVSRIALGCMGLAGTWKPEEVGPQHVKKAIAAFEAALEAGITLFDHADIYGWGASESVFAQCLKSVRGSREQIFIATKFGIRKGQYFDHSPGHIRDAIRGSLDRMGIDFVDLYQVHRPDPLAHPAQTAETLDALVEDGLIKQIGVSNYSPQQLLALKRYLSAPIVSNQVQISLLHLDSIYEGALGGPAVETWGDGVLDQCIELNLTPMAWSPLGGGWLTGRKDPPADHPKREHIDRVMTALREMGKSYDGATPTQLAIAWLLAHPAKIIPIVGSNHPAHIREAAAAAEVQISRTDWYKLWVAGRGEEVP
ncbi:MAG: aldo/keto reductase [Tepidisphaeraceae bacterium]